MRVLVYGAGGFACTVIELLSACGHDPAGLVDDIRQDADILGNLQAVIRSHPPSEYGIALAIGYNNLIGRWAAWMQARLAGYEAPALIHPRAYVAPSARVAAGCMVMAGALVDVRANVGEATVLWPGVCVSHDTTIGANCFLSPNSTVCGNVSLGANSFVGAGAAIVDRCEVPASSFIPMLGRYTGRAK